MDNRRPEKQTMTIAFLLAQLGARAAQEFGKALEPLNFTPPEAGILRLLSRSPGLSQQELARRLGMHASRLVAVIDALEGRGAVERVTNPSDRRLHSLELTAKGKESLGAIGKAAQAHEEAICTGLSDAERAQLRGLLEKIAGGLGLVPGIHPGYRTLGAKGEDKSVPCP